MYTATTHSIRIDVVPEYLGLQVKAADEPVNHCWTYTITITNEGADTVQLMRRHWVITDAHGHRQEVGGEGVVGETPILAQGQSFSYKSGVPLSTEHGVMSGDYLFVRLSDNTPLLVAVPAFSLDKPDTTRAVH